MNLIKPCFFIMIGLATMGCSTTSTTHTLQIIEYPGFFAVNSAYQSIAIAPIQNSVEPGVYSQKLNENLVKGLNEKKYYRILDYTNTIKDDNELLSHLQESGTADLVVFSTLTDYWEKYDTDVETKQESEDVYAVDENGYTLMDDYNRPVVDHVEYYDIEYPIYKLIGLAKMNIQLIDVQTGITLINKDIEGSYSDTDDDPDDLKTPEYARESALQSVIRNEITEFSPRKIELKIKENEVMAIYHHKPENHDKGYVFSQDDTLRVVLNFPKEALYNTFAYDIVYNDEASKNEMMMLSDEFRWDGTPYLRDLPIHDLLSLSHGAKTYHIRLWYHDQIVFSKKIEVK